MAGTIIAAPRAVSVSRPKGPLRRAADRFLANWAAPVGRVENPAAA